MINPKLRWRLLSMGATQWQVNWLLIKEARLGLMAAIMAGFGRVISEVGASMMVDLMDKWRITDLNRWPLRCDRSALPTELIPQNLC